MVVIVVHRYTEWQTYHCSMDGYLTIMGGFKFWWLDSNLDGWIPTYPQAIYRSLLDSWFLVFGISDYKTNIQLYRRWDHTCIHVTTLRYDSNHQTEDRPSNHRSARRAFVASLATWGNISHKVLGMSNWPLPSSVEVKLTRRCIVTAWTMYTFIYPIWKIISIFEVRKGTRGRTMNIYWNTRFNPSATKVQ